MWKSSKDSPCQSSPIKTLRKCPPCSEAFRYFYNAKKRYRGITAPLTLKSVAMDWGSDISTCGQTESLAQMFERGCLL